VKEARNSAVPPRRYDKREIKAYNHPWAIAWRMLDHGHTAEEIARTLHKSYGIPFSRAICIGKFVIRRKYGDEQEALEKKFDIKKYGPNINRKDVNRLIKGLEKKKVWTNWQERKKINNDIDYLKKLGDF